MPRAKREPVTPNGRPQKEIIWEEVDAFLEAGCLGTEIASYFDMHPQTFYDRIQIEKGMGFTEYSSEKKPKGEALLRKKQYQKALEGDNVMLVWLGKNRLSQRENSEVTVAPETMKSFCSVMNNLKMFQEGRHSSPEPKPDDTKITPFKTHFPTDEEPV